MKTRVCTVVLALLLICLFPSKVIGDESDDFSLIAYCQTHTIESQMELDAVLGYYCDRSTEVSNGELTEDYFFTQDMWWLIQVSFLVELFIVHN